MTFSLWKFAALGLSLTVTGSVLALGLGNASGHPVLGQPLQVEIPLLGTDEGVPPLECFRIRPPASEIESAFVLRNAHLQIRGDRTHAKLILTSASAVREPVIEFGLAVSCGYALSKDFLLLTAEPSRIALPTQSDKQPDSASGESHNNATDLPKLPPKPIVTVASTANLLRIESGLTLAALARQRYPLQPKAREKFMRMMTQANPDIRQADSMIVAGSELQVPPGLPVRRMGAYRQEPKIAPSADHSMAQDATASPPVPAKKSPVPTTKSHQDLLVLGSPGRNAAELLAEAERLTTVLVEQTNAQIATSEKITQLEDSLATLKKLVVSLENRIHTIEAERQAEKFAPKPASLDFVELFLAVLAGGAIGSLTLHFYNRIRVRRDPDPKKPDGITDGKGNRAASPGGSALPTEAQRQEGLPWQKGYQPKPQASPKPASEAPPQEVPGLSPQPATPQNDFDFVSKQ